MSSNSERVETEENIEIAVDIGGTFTDVVCLKGGSTLFSTKVPSTPRNLVLGVEQGVNEVLRLANGHHEHVHRFIHGTTVATNAVLERKGATIAVLMTDGFEDTLEMGRQKRTELYDLFLDPQTPGFLAPRRLRVGIRERVDFEGNVICPLDEDQVKEAIDNLVTGHGIQAVAVCYLFSFINPTHERRTSEIIQERHPHLRVSLSSEIDPTFREYERVCVTAFDAYLRPVMETYVRRLSEELSRMGISGRLQLMQSRGGITSDQRAIEKPVTMLLSGPAGGVIGGKFAGERSGFKNLITMDIGGTSCDIALIQEGKALTSIQTRIRNYPLRVPTIDVTTIGSGGGSIAWLDDAKSLHVGPQSAGADPGPVCYGRGGQAPTVTDASVVLGYLNPNYFAGGKLDLDVEAAKKAIASLAEQLGTDLVGAAHGIHKIVNAQMADETRLVSIYRGFDPRRFALVLLGGAGPVHGGLIAAELSIPVAIIPETPGVLSAFGLLVASVEHDNARTLICSGGEIKVNRISMIFKDLERMGEVEMERDGIALNEVKILRSADIRYKGQAFELEVPIFGIIGQKSLETAVEDFHKLHQRVYGHCSYKDEVEFVNFRTVHSYSLPAPSLLSQTSKGSLSGAQKGTRLAYFGQMGFAPTPFYDRYKIPLDCVIQGPAIIEQPDTTTVVYPEQRCYVDPAGNIIMRTFGDGND